MASKISGLTAAVTVAAIDELEINIVGTGSRKVTPAQIVAAALNASGPLYIGDTANANNSKGLTVNQQDADDHAFTLKSSDVAHALTSAGGSAETDDYFFIWKQSPTLGGAAIVAIGENSASLTTSFSFNAFGGQASTTDTSTSDGLMRFRIGEHDGANALVDTGDTDNIWTVACRRSGAWATQFLVKGNGTLHITNTTPVALDEEDDVMAIRGLQKVMSRNMGIVPQPFDNRAYSYTALRRLGIVGKKDKHGNFMIRIQPVIALLLGGMGQMYAELQQLKARV